MDTVSSPENPSKRPFNKNTEWIIANDNNCQVPHQTVASLTVETHHDLILSNSGTLHPYLSSGLNRKS